MPEYSLVLTFDEGVIKTLRRIKLEVRSMGNKDI